MLFSAIKVAISTIIFSLNNTIRILNVILIAKKIIKSIHMYLNLCKLGLIFYVLFNNVNGRYIFLINSSHDMKGYRRTTGFNFWNIKCLNLMMNSVYLSINTLK